MYTIKLADGTEIKNVGMNGNCYTSTDNITEKTFDGKLDKVIISEDDIEKEVIDNAVLATLLQHPDGYILFGLRPRTDEEKREAELSFIKEENRNLRAAFNDVNDVLLELIFGKSEDIDEGKDDVE